MEIVSPLCMYPLVFSFSVTVYDLPSAMFYHVGILHVETRYRLPMMTRKFLVIVGSLVVLCYSLVE